MSTYERGHWSSLYLITYQKNMYVSLDYDRLDCRRHCLVLNKIIIRG